MKKCNNCMDNIHEDNGYFKGSNLNTRSGQWSKIKVAPYCKPCETFRSKFYVTLKKLKSFVSQELQDQLTSLNKQFSDRNYINKYRKPEFRTLILKQ